MRQSRRRPILSVCRWASTVLTVLLLALEVGCAWWYRSPDTVVHSPIPAWPFVLLTMWLWSLDPRRQSGLCTRCEYDLRGNTSGVCPECGMGRG